MGSSGNLLAEVAQPFIDRFERLKQTVVTTVDEQLVSPVRTSIANAFANAARAVSGRGSSAVTFSRQAKGQVDDGEKRVASGECLWATVILTIDLAITIIVAAFTAKGHVAAAARAAASAKSGRERRAHIGRVDGRRWRWRRCGDWRRVVALLVAALLVLRPRDSLSDRRRALRATRLRGDDLAARVLSRVRSKGCYLDE